MTIEKIKQLCNAEPFRPFIFHFPDGRDIGVHHPDFVAFSPSGRLIVLVHEDDSESVIDPMLISDVTIKGRAPRNGKH